MIWVILAWFACLVGLSATAAAIQHFVGRSTRRRIRRQAEADGKILAAWLYEQPRPFAGLRRRDSEVEAALERLRARERQRRGA